MSDTTLQLTTKGKENLARVVELKKNEIVAVAAANVRAMGLVKVSSWREVRY